MRVHFFSPPPRVRTDRAPATTLLGRTGGNTGNLLFVSALVRQIAHDEASFGYRFDADDINANADLVVVPAANWLQTGVDLRDRYEALEPVRVPILVAGLGAQAGEEGEIPDLPEGTRAFLRLISERGVSVGTRGAFTTRVLEHYGVGNAATVGCPSLYFHCRPEFPAIRPPGDLVEERVALQATKHEAKPRALRRPGRVATQRRLVGAAMASRTAYVLQSEREEILLALGAGLEPEAARKLALYYGVDDLAAIVGFVARMRVFFDVGAWMDFLAGLDFVCGSRLHGAITSLLAGTPATLLVHDSRTAEMADLAALPRFGLADFLAVAETEGTMAAVRRAATAFSAAQLVERFPENYRAYRAFLEANGVAHRLG